MRRCLQVIFTDPYYAAPHNRHTSPQLDADVAALRADVAARAAAAELKVGQTSTFLDCPILPSLCGYHELSVSHVIN
jgi:hypothetical protein